MLDILIFALTWWNAFDRPRHMQTRLLKQLVTDGAFYFFVSILYMLHDVMCIFPDYHVDCNAVRFE